MAKLEFPKKYPQTQIFLSTHIIPLPLLKPKVFEAFQGYTQLTQPESKKILTPKFYPEIKVTQTPSGTYGWTPATGNRIWLNNQFIAQFESLLSGRTEITSGPWTAYEDQRFKNKVLIPKLFLLLEATVLHELVHFGRKLVFGYNPDRAMEERIAQNFERKAYGQVHTLTSLGISHIVSEPS
jgi:hypothetical protein